MIKRTLKGTSIELTPAIEAAVEKAVKALDKYVDPTDTSALADIEVGKSTNHHRSGEIFRAEINFHSRIGSLRSEAEKEDLYAAIIAAKDEIVEALRSKKAKKIDFVRRSGLKLKNMLKGLPWMRDSE
ncbi:MAG: ribosome-associated translation inhibitor RaiA [Candidatus Taylorbacteria bacterium]|nr:ribosome-associated translation inhibitor RaiA [Candidatus Taylorbacteria bacterium]